MERKLASIQIIKSLEDVPNADRLQVAEVLGWKTVVSKGQFNVGDTVVYVEYDSILPPHPEFDFLANKNYRVKTIKLRGQVSQGLCFSPSILKTLNPELPDCELYEGQDVTPLMKIIKFEPYNPEDGTGMMKGTFPQFIIKTDETRVQAVPRVLERYYGTRIPFYVAEKLDGKSTTIYFNNGVVGACSRNQEVHDVEGNEVWKIVHEYDLIRKLTNYNQNIALQGELIGTGIQGNKYSLTNKVFRLFNVFDIDAFRRRGLHAIMDIAGDFSLATVPLLEVHFHLPATIEEIVKYSEGFSKLNPKVYREGVVIRSLEYTEDRDLGDLSFKVISPQYLLKHNE